MSACVICTVKQDDVKNAVEEMNSRGVNCALIQTSGKKYHSMDNNRDEVLPMTERVNNQFNYVIHMCTATIHTSEDCVKDGGDDYIKARIINLPATGLELCEKCIKEGR